MAIDTETRTSRRGILAAALGGAGALLASRLGRPDAARAADTDPAVMGAANESSTETGFENTDPGEVSVHARQTTGTAVEATATSGIGLQANATSGAAIRADSTDATPSGFNPGSYRSGVVAAVGDRGTPGQASGIVDNSDEIAVYGFSNISDLSSGVWGDSWLGVGVQGTGATGVLGTGSDGVVGVGAYGVTGYGDTAGLYGAANAPTGYALLTSGRIRFAGRSGRATITSGHQYRDVAIIGMTSSNAVIVTLQTYKSGYAVAAAISYAGKFRLYLNKTATSTMAFSYLVIG